MGQTVDGWGFRERRVVVPVQSTVYPVHGYGVGTGVRSPRVGGLRQFAQSLMGDKNELISAI